MVLLIVAATESGFAANAIQIENQKQGTTAWQIGLPPYVNSNDTDQWIRGYASATSINKGEKITFNITVNPYSWKAGPVAYTIDVYRVGWYNGTGGRLMLRAGPFTGKQQPGGTSSGGVTSPGCPYDATTGMIECQWSGDGQGNGSYTLDTSANTLSGSPDWTSGIYLALLTTRQVQYPTGCGPSGTAPCDPDHQSYIIFTIREDQRASTILFQQAVATYQAYNNYPDDGLTGKSLYDSGSYGPATTLGTQRAVKVSFDRPYTYSDHTGAGDFLHWELYFVRWLERNGYDATYATDVDIHGNAGLLINHKTFLSAGHPEYWSREMRQAVENARDNGLHLGFFGANTVYTQIRFEPSPTTQRPSRVIVCYKNPMLDPVNQQGSSYTPTLTTVPFRSSPVNRPEQSLLGVMYDDYFDAEAPAQSYVVKNSAHWIYSGTGLSEGSKIAGVLGYEMDRQFSTFPLPTALSGTYTLLSQSPFTGVGGDGTANSSIYRAGAGPGAWVFAAGTIDWSWGLDGYVPPLGIKTDGFAAPHAGLQQATANFLNRTTGRLANPTGLTASSATKSGGKVKISLNWHNNASTQTGVNVERSSDGIAFALLTTTGPKANSFTDTNVLPSTAYYYRVAAFNAVDTSAYSNVVGSGLVPAAPFGLAAVATSSSQIDLSWTNSASTVTAVLLEGSTDNTNFTQIGSVAPDLTSYSDTKALHAGTTYYYRARAQNSDGTSTYSNTASATTFGPPAAPGRLNATAVSPTQINLRWQKSSTNETGFSIYRSTDGINFAQVGVAPSGATGYAHPGLAGGVTYYYYVQAYNTYGVSAASNTASATTKK